MTETTDLSIDVATIELDTPADHVALTIGRIDDAIRRAKELKAELEATLLEWIPANGGELIIGDVRYYVGPDKKVKCRSISATVTALMEISGGDYDAFCECLSANAIKPGAARKLLADKFDEFFETTETLDLKTGKPLKKVQAINTRFLR
jgi:hypothetical protein